MIGGPIALGILILLLSGFISMNLDDGQRLPIIRSGFVGGMFELKRNALTNLKCGVDLPSCGENMRCVNGFCRSQDIPVLKGTGLRVVP
jgi:hypothetical protein